MRKYNFMRPILLLAIAFFVYNLASSICLLFGLSQETAGNIAFVAMMIAALITFQRLNRNRRKQ